MSITRIFYFIFHLFRQYFDYLHTMDNFISLIIRLIFGFNLLYPIRSTLEPFKSKFNSNNIGRSIRS